MGKMINDSAFIIQHSRENDSLFSHLRLAVGVCCGTNLLSAAHLCRHAGSELGAEAGTLASMQEEGRSVGQVQCCRQVCQQRAYFPALRLPSSRVCRNGVGFGGGRGGSRGESSIKGWSASSTIVGRLSEKLIT